MGDNLNWHGRDKCNLHCFYPPGSRPSQLFSYDHINYNVILSFILLHTQPHCRVSSSIVKGCHYLHHHKQQKQCSIVFLELSFSVHRHVVV